MRTLRPIHGADVAIRPRVAIRPGVTLGSGVALLLPVPLRLIVALRLAIPLLAIPLLIVVLRTRFALVAVFASTRLTPTFVRPVATDCLVTAVLVVILVGGVAILVLSAIVAAVVSARTVLVEARAIFVEDAVVMIRELQIIFGLHAIARELRIARHRLVLFVQLRRVAPCPCFGTIAAAAIGSAFHPLRTRTPATAAASLLSIVDQWVSF